MTFAYDFIETENENKEVLGHQFVTTSMVMQALSFIIMKTVELNYSGKAIW